MQPLVGWVLDRHWSGALTAGRRAALRPRRLPQRLLDAASPGARSRSCPRAHARDALQAVRVRPPRRFRGENGAGRNPGADMDDVRIEKDSFGPIEVPAARLWGAQTQRSLEHFRISGERMPRGDHRGAGVDQARLRERERVAAAGSPRKRPGPSRRPRTRCWRGAGPASFRWSCGRPAPARSRT